MKITVKNLKTAEFASEETLCFNATVYIDGVRAFTASNQGFGGCNMYHPLKGDTHETHLKRAEEWVAKQPEIVCDDLKDPHDRNKPFSYQPDLDHFVGEAIANVQYEKELKKTLKKAAIFEGGKIFTYRCAIDHPKIRAVIEKDHPKAVILNDVPFEEALALVRDIL